ACLPGIDIPGRLHKRNCLVEDMRPYSWGRPVSGLITAGRRSLEEGRYRSVLQRFTAPLDGLLALWLSGSGPDIAVRCGSGGPVVTKRIAPFAIGFVLRLVGRSVIAHHVRSR